MTVYLDGRQMPDRVAAHAYLKEALSLPDHYGRNLDALYDLLTERGETTEIVLTHFAEMESAMGHYAPALLHTLEEAAESNPRLTVRVEE